MLGLLAPTLIALIAVPLFGGSLRRVVNSEIRGWPLIVGCFALELLLYNPPMNAQTWAMQVGPGVWLITRLVFLGVLIGNGWPTRQPLAWPWWLAALGLALNTLVMSGAPVTSIRLGCKTWCRWWLKRASPGWVTSSPSRAGCLAPT